MLKSFRGIAMSNTANRHLAKTHLFSKVPNVYTKSDPEYPVLI